MTESCKDSTRAVARFASTLDWSIVPSKIKAEACRRLLDSVGCILSARRTHVAPIDGMADFLEDGDAASVVERKQRINLAGALCANGRLESCMDLDETLPVGHHFGAAVFVAALGVAVAGKATGSKLLQSATAGQKVGGRVASAHGARGFGGGGCGRRCCNL